MTNTTNPVLAVIDARIAKVRNVLEGAAYSGRYDIAAEAQMTLLRDIRSEIVALEEN